MKQKTELVKKRENILGKVYGPINQDNVRRRIHNKEISDKYNQPDVVGIKYIVTRCFEYYLVFLLSTGAVVLTRILEIQI